MRVNAGMDRTRFLTHARKFQIWNILYSYTRSKNAGIFQMLQIYYWDGNGKVIYMDDTPLTIPHMEHAEGVTLCKLACHSLACTVKIYNTVRIWYQGLTLGKLTVHFLNL